MLKVAKGGQGAVNRWVHLSAGLRMTGNKAVLHCITFYSWLAESKLIPISFCSWGWAGQRHYSSECFSRSYSTPEKELPLSPRPSDTKKRRVGRR